VAAGYAANVAGVATRAAGVATACAGVPIPFVTTSVASSACRTSHASVERHITRFGKYKRKTSCGCGAEPPDGLPTPFAVAGEQPSQRTGRIPGWLPWVYPMTLTRLVSQCLAVDLWTPRRSTLPSLATCNAWWSGSNDPYAVQRRRGWQMPGRHSLRRFFLDSLILPF